MIASQQYDPGWEASGRELGWHDEGDKTLSPTSQGQFWNDYDDVYGMMMTIMFLTTRGEVDEFLMSQV